MFFILVESRLFGHSLSKCLERKLLNILTGFISCVDTVGTCCTLDSTSLDQAKSDLGRCRAWLRLAINENSLQSYITTILNDVSLIK